MPSKDLAFPLYSALSTRNCCLLTYKKSLKMYHLWTSYFLMKGRIVKIYGQGIREDKACPSHHQAMFSINFVGANGSARLPFGVLSLEISHLSGN
ncbi:hypothetical protein ACB092_09G196200 [Castanea dentata]